MVDVATITIQDERRWNSIRCTFSPSAAIFLFFLLFGFAAIPTATPLSLSDQIPAQPAIPIGRTLLQAQQGCPVNFENLNYTIITSRCKGPKYPPDLCCAAFKEFACPYAQELNDQNNNCATTMFSYINLYGNYPPGLFANECRDSKRGLECSASQPNSNSNSSSAAPSPLLILFAAASLPIFCHLQLL